jgi:MFS family permease
VTTLAEKHFLLNGEIVYGSFNGIFFSIVQFTQVSGNIISTFVLRYGYQNSTPTSAPNPPDFSHQFEESTDEGTIPWITKFVLYISFAVCCVIGFFILLIWVKRLDRRHLPSDTKNIWSSSRFGSFGQDIRPGSNIFATFCLTIRLEMFLMIPIMVTNGFEMGFAFSSLTKDVIASKLGEENIGDCMLIFGIALALSSLFVGILSDRVGKVICIS